LKKWTSLKCNVNGEWRDLNAQGRSTTNAKMYTTHAQLQEQTLHVVFVAKFMGETALLGGLFDEFVHERAGGIV